MQTIRDLTFTILSLYGTLEAFFNNNTVSVGNNWPKPIKNFVVFGDSYSDVSYVWDGGDPWPVYTERYTGMTLYPYAASGGTCSNEIIRREYPSVLESQVPKYFRDLVTGEVPYPSPDETVYTIWIGTNDVGTGGLLDSRGAIEGSTATLIDTSTCVVNWINTMYDNGARNFIVQNMIPLQHTVLYSVDTYPNFFWAGEHDSSAWNLRIHQLTADGNEITLSMLKQLASKLSGAHIALFDSSALFYDILDHPQLYLNGTAPIELNKPVKKCVYPANGDPMKDRPECEEVSKTDADSHLWYDELHPSEQVNRVVAKELAKALEGEDNRWTTWLN